MTVPRCCLTTPDPGSWKAGVDDGASPDMIRVMHSIRNKLSYRMPIRDFVWALRASVQIDSRTMLGGDIQRCLLSNAADRIEVLALHKDPLPWLRPLDRIRDAWAVLQRRAVVVYVKEPE